MSYFKFKDFEIEQKAPVFKIGTDSMVLLAFISQEETAASRILDIGCGTGVLAIGLGTRFSEARICAINIQEKAAILATANFKRNRLQNRGQAVNISLEEFTSLEDFDCIVSNPPYFTNDLKNIDNLKRTARHDDTLPLDLLFNKVAQLLSKNGVFWMIYPYDERKNVIATANTHGLHLYKRIMVYGKPNQLTRVIYCFGLNAKTNSIEESFVVRSENGSYTDDYIELTKQLHAIALK